MTSAHTCHSLKVWLAGTRGIFQHTHKARHLRPVPWLVQADKQHVFAAVISCNPTAQGGRYLQRHIQRELQSQIRQHGGNVQAALPAALRALNQAFRDMHPFNGSVFEGVRISLAYIDARTKVGTRCPLHECLA